MELKMTSAYLPPQSALMTTEGIQFGDLHYSCPILIKDGWYENVLIFGICEVKIFHDPQCEDFILIPHEILGLIIATRISKVSIPEENEYLIQEYYRKFQFLKKQRKNMLKLHSSRKTKENNKKL
jgi:hypothetical protein